MFSFSSIFASNNNNNNKRIASVKAMSLRNQTPNPNQDENQVISTVEKILEWKPPTELTENFSYYTSGYDNDASPVWIIEFGHWNIRSLLDTRGELVPDFDKYIHQMWHKMYASGRKNEVDSSSENQHDSLAAKGFVLIVNIEGYSYDQYLHSQTVKKNLEMFQSLFNMQNIQQPSGLKICYALNANFAARSFWAAVRSIVGPMASKFDLYGTNSRKWKSVLRRHIPVDALPKTLGGSRNRTSLKRNSKKFKK